MLCIEPDKAIMRDFSANSIQFSFRIARNGGNEKKEKYELILFSPRPTIDPAFSRKHNNSFAGLDRQVMHLLLPLVRRRALALIQLKFKWTRSLVHKSDQLEKIEHSIGTAKQEQRSGTCDPFELEHLGLESIVQGLYSKSEDDFQVNAKDDGKDRAKDVEITPSVASAEQKPSKKPVTKASVEEKYKDWFIDKKPNIIGPDSELIRSTSFGTIRFDNDNAAKARNYVYTHDTTESTKSEPKTNSNANTDPSKKVPRIYERQDYNEITHLDMWTIIRKSVVFQNDFLIAINKPYGLPMHSATTDCRHTIIQFLDEFAQLGKCERVYQVHRLDKDTTGVLLLTKSEKAAEVIKSKFKNKQISKIYLAIAKGCPHIPQGTVKIPISEGKVGGTDNYRCTLKPDLTVYDIPTKQTFSKEAITNFKVLSSDHDCSFLEVNTETGVKHQIRVHLAMGLGCPILGDHKYSHREKLAPQRLGTSVLDRLNISQTKVRNLPIHLHCSQVKFTMPDGFTTNKEPIFVTARPPHFFIYSLRRLHLT